MPFMMVVLHENEINLFSFTLHSVFNKNRLFRVKSKKKHRSTKASSVHIRKNLHASRCGIMIRRTIFLGQKCPKDKHSMCCDEFSIQTKV